MLNELLLNLARWLDSQSWAQPFMNQFFVRLD